MYLITFYTGKERKFHSKRITFFKSRALKAIKAWDKLDFHHVANYEEVEVLK